MKKLKYTLLFLLVIIQIASPKSIRWIVDGEMPSPVYNGQALVIGSQIYILGGYSAFTNLPSDTIQAYDPATHSWSVVGHMNSPRADFSADIYGTDIIIFGGTNMDTTSIGNFEILSSNDTNSFFLDFNDSTNRINAVGGIYESSFFVFGGYDVAIESDSPQPYIIEFDLDTRNAKSHSNSYSSFDSQLPYQQMLSLIDQDFYIFGGVFFVPAKKVYKFNTLTGTHERIYPDLYQARAGGVAVRGLEDSIMLIGGFNESESALATTELYSINYYGEQIGYSTDYGSTLNYARNECMAVNYQDTIYVFGGVDENGNVVPYIERMGLYEVATQLDESNKSIKSFILHNNYPNPFNSNTNISFELIKDQHTKLQIFNTQGRLVKTILDQPLNSGFHEITWDGTDTNNQSVSSNVYFYQLITDNGSEIKKMVLMK